MKPYYADDAVTIWHGDCLDVLAQLPDASVDAVVTDPPYLLGFMGRQWDTRAAHEHLDWHGAWAAEAFRLLKPGGHLLAFGGTRTWHRLACAVEDAGFEIRDSIAWLYASGFPKSRNLDGEWKGWGTALKPAFEPVVVARKPLAGTVAANVLAYGTGALNIDATRVDTDGRPLREKVGTTAPGSSFDTAHTRALGERANTQGRWPANVVLDGDAADELDRQSGDRPGFASGGAKGAGFRREYVGGQPHEETLPAQTYGDSGGASRFFPTFRYEPKAPTAERPRVAKDQSSAQVLSGINRLVCATCGKRPQNVPGSACTCREPDLRPDAGQVGHVAHPTVKPLDLMRWLVRLVTPPGGLVLDPFAGSGTTAEACLIEGFRCITVEREAEYLPLIAARLSKPIEPVLDLGGLLA